MPDLGTVFQKLDTRHNPERPPAVPKSASEPLSARSVPYDEPSNEELGIKPDRRPLVAYLLITLALVFYLAISWGMGWGPFR